MSEGEGRRYGMYAKVQRLTIDCDMSQQYVYLQQKSNRLQTILQDYKHLNLDDFYLFLSMQKCMTLIVQTATMNFAWQNLASKFWMLHFGIQCWLMFVIYYNLGSNFWMVFVMT